MTALWKMTFRRVIGDTRRQEGIWQYPVAMVGSFGVFEEMGRSGQILRDFRG